MARPPCQLSPSSQSLACPLAPNTYKMNHLLPTVTSPSPCHAPRRQRLPTNYSLPNVTLILAPAMPPGLRRLPMSNFLPTVTLIPVPNMPSLPLADLFPLAPTERMPLAHLMPGLQVCASLLPAVARAFLTTVDLPPPNAWTCLSNIQHTVTPHPYHTDLPEPHT